MADGSKRVRDEEVVGSTWGWEGALDLPLPLSPLADPRALRVKRWPDPHGRGRGRWTRPSLTTADGISLAPARRYRLRQPSPPLSPSPAVALARARRHCASPLLPPEPEVAAVARECGRERAGRGVGELEREGEEWGERECEEWTGERT